MTAADRPAEEAVERVAEAIYREDDTQTDARLVPGQWAHLCEYYPLAAERYRRMARAALAAMPPEGYVMVAADQSGSDSP